MTHLIIWGKTRDIVAGELPGSAQAEEVSTLAALEKSLDGRGAALVLADAERLEAERDAAEAWLRGGGTERVVLIAVAQAGDGDALLKRLPFVDDLLVRPVTPAYLSMRVERAIESVNNRRVIQQLEAKLSRKGDELSELNKIGVALSAERDIDKLLRLILSKSREITGADAGSLYIVERGEGKHGGDGRPGEPRGGSLLFELAQNDTVAVPFEKFTMPLDVKSIAGYAAISGRVVNVADAYRLPEDSPFHISRSFDEKSGYRSKSMLVVPMLDHQNVVIGVVQLINKKRDPRAVLQASLVEEEVIPFTSVDEELTRSLASQAAVAYENAQLIQQIRQLFERFIYRAVTAIELRDPTTAGHSERVKDLSVCLIERVDAISTGPLADVRFTRDQIEELRYAALLHDFGKVAVQEKYLRKGKKLYASRMVAIEQRFAYILKSIEADYLRKRLATPASGRAAAREIEALEKEFQERQAGARRVLDMVRRANEPKVVEDETFRALMNLPARPFKDFEAQDSLPVDAWAEEPFLSTPEIEALSISKGSLSDEERRMIQSHVQHTYEFLKTLPWTPEFKRIPEIAWKHHEKLDGSGYPQKLKAPDIPAQSRIMTIADIYDALVAWDRPYKPPVSEERARDILCHEAEKGQLDKDLLQVFLETRVYDHPEFRKKLRPKA